MGIDFLNSPNVANSGSKPKNFSVIYQKDYNNIEVIYFGELYKKTNSNYVKRTLYNSGANFKIGYAWSEGAKPIFATDYHPITGDPFQVQIGTDYSLAGKFSIKTESSFVRDYTYYDLDFYAMARRGGTWKGNRMIREEKK